MPQATAAGQRAQARLRQPPPCSKRSVIFTASAVPAPCGALQEVSRLQDEVASLHRERTAWKVGEWLESASGLSHVRAAAAANANAANATPPAANQHNSSNAAAAAPAAAAHAPPAAAARTTASASTPPRSTVPEGGRSSLNHLPSPMLQQQASKLSSVHGAAAAVAAAAAAAAAAENAGGADAAAAELQALRAQVQQLEAELAQALAQAASASTAPAAAHTNNATGKSSNPNAPGAAQQQQLTSPHMTLLAPHPSQAAGAMGRLAASLKDVVLNRDGSMVLVSECKPSLTGGSATPERKESATAAGQVRRCCWAAARERKASCWRAVRAWPQASGCVRGTCAGVRRTRRRAGRRPGAAAGRARAAPCPRRRRRPSPLFWTWPRTQTAARAWRRCPRRCPSCKCVACAIVVAPLLWQRGPSQASCRTLLATTQDALAKLTEDREEQAALRQIEVQHLKYMYRQQMQERDQMIEVLREQLSDAVRRAEHAESLIALEGQHLGGLMDSTVRAGSVCSGSQVRPARARRPIACSPAPLPRTPSDSRPFRSRIRPQELTSIRSGISFLHQHQSLGHGVSSSMHTAHLAFAGGSVPHPTSTAGGGNNGAPGLSPRGGAAARNLAGTGTSAGVAGGSGGGGSGCPHCVASGLQQLRLQEQVQQLKSQLSEAQEQSQKSTRTAADLAAQLAGAQAQLHDAQAQAQAAVRSAADLAEQVAKLSKGQPPAPLLIPGGGHAGGDGVSPKGAGSGSLARERSVNTAMTSQVSQVRRGALPPLDAGTGGRLWDLVMKRRAQGACCCCSALHGVPAAAGGPGARGGGARAAHGAGAGAGRPGGGPGGRRGGTRRHARFARRGRRGEGAGAARAGGGGQGQVRPRS